MTYDCSAIVHKNYIYCSVKCVWTVHVRFAYNCRQIYLIKRWYPVTNLLYLIYVFLFLLSQYVKEKVNKRKVQDVHITQNCTLWYKGYRDAIVAYLLILTQFFRRLKNPCIRCRRIFPFKTKYIELFLALFQSTGKIV